MCLRSTCLKTCWNTLPIYEHVDRINAKSSKPRSFVELLQLTPDAAPAPTRPPPDGLLESGRLSQGEFRAALESAGAPLSAKEVWVRGCISSAKTTAQSQLIATPGRMKIKGALVTN